MKDLISSLSAMKKGIWFEYYDNVFLFDNILKIYKSIGTVSYACSYIFNSYLGHG